VFVALGIQHVMRMRCIIISVAYPVLSKFSILTHKRKNCQKTRTEAKICVFISSTKWFEMFLILIITERHVSIYIYIYMYTSLHLVYPFYI